jgi:hypothetical protein
VPATLRAYFTYKLNKRHRLIHRINRVSIKRNLEFTEQIRGYCWILPAEAIGIRTLFAPASRQTCKRPARFSITPTEPPIVMLPRIAVCSLQGFFYCSWAEADEGWKGEFFGHAHSIKVPDVQEVVFFFYRDALAYGFCIGPEIIESRFYWLFGLRIWTCAWFFVFSGAGYYLDFKLVSWIFNYWAFTLIAFISITD